MLRLMSRYYSRPHPKMLYEEVKGLVNGTDRWNSRAKQLCEARWYNAASSEAQSSGQQGWNS